MAIPPFAIIMATLGSLVAVIALIPGRDTQPSLRPSANECYTVEYAGAPVRTGLDLPAIAVNGPFRGVMLSHSVNGDSVHRLTVVARAALWRLRDTMTAETAFDIGSHKVRLATSVSGAAFVDIDSFHFVGRLAPCDPGVVAENLRVLGARAAGCYEFHFDDDKLIAPAGDFWAGPVRLAWSTSKRIQHFFNDSGYYALVAAGPHRSSPDRMVSYWRSVGWRLMVGRTDGLVSTQMLLEPHGDTLRGTMMLHGDAGNEAWGHAMRVIALRVSCATKPKRRVPTTIDGI